MATATLRADIARLKRSITERQARTDPLASRLSADPVRILTDAGISPDPWQARVLRSDDPRVLLLCSRQSGKSFTAAAVALKTALTQAGSLILLLSPTLRQSGELFRDKLLRLWRKLGEPLRSRRPTILEMELSNGSRIVSLPESEEGVRCFSGVTLIILDEAARVADDLYRAVRPMLATSRGRLVALSTAFGQRGFFYDAWTGPEKWLRVRIPADQCPRIPAEFLAEERQALGDRWYSQEYGCTFIGIVGAVFDPEIVDAAMRDDLTPIFLAVE